MSPEPPRLDKAFWAALSHLAEALPLGILHVDARGHLVYANRRHYFILGVSESATLEEQLSVVLPEDQDLVKQAFKDVLQSGLDNDIVMRLAKSDEHGAKSVRYCMLSLRALTGGTDEITGAIACNVDVSESVRLQKELRVRGTYDEVTRCYNRASTVEALETALAAADDKGGPAVIYVDLDRFKDVNDQLGHAAGDELLRVVVERLRSGVRSEDLVGRIGGDEFLVICPGITTAAQAMRAAKRVADALLHQVRLKSTIVSCRASIGVAWSFPPRVDADTLMSQADSAMYEAKRRGTGRPVLYTAFGSGGSAHTPAVGPEPTAFGDPDDASPQRPNASATVGEERS